MIATQFGVPREFARDAGVGFVRVERRRYGLRDLAVQKVPPGLRQASVRGAADQIVREIITSLAHTAEYTASFQLFESVAPFRG